jgi:hypothetical protein
MDPTKEQHNILCRSQESAAETSTLIRQAFGKKKNMSCESKLNETEKGEIYQGKIQKNARHFL